jgi:uncharacterized cupredoxin-like copper-binding protein
MDASHAWRALRLGIGFAVLTAAACTAAAPAPARSETSAPPTVADLQVEALDFSFVIPDTLPSGWTKITLKNTGQSPHHVQLFRGKANVTSQQLQDAIKVGPEAIFKIATAEGGPGTVVPTSSTETYLRLLPGTYLLACFVSGADHVPHLAKGMTKVVTVTDKSSGSLLTAPQTEAVVQLKDFTIQGIPETLPAGRHVFRVSNAGPQPHEANVLQLAPGKTARDVLEFFASPAGQSPFTPMGGVQGVTPGTEDALLVLDLKPGNYLAICNIPDPASGKPHAALGMVKEFTVK